MFFTRIIKHNYFAGLSFRGFLDACHEIARRKFSSSDTLKMMEEFIDYCQDNLQDDQLYQARCNSRFIYRRAHPHGYPFLEPMIASLQSPSPSQSPLFAEAHKALFPDRHSSSGRYLKPTSANDVSFFLQQKHRQLESIKKSKRAKSRNKDDNEL